MSDVCIQGLNWRGKEVPWDVIYTALHIPDTPRALFPFIAHLRCPSQLREELQRVVDVSERVQQPTFFTSFLPLLRKAVVTSTGIKIMQTFFWSFFLEATELGFSLLQGPSWLQKMVQRAAPHKERCSQPTCASLSLPWTDFNSDIKNCPTILQGFLATSRVAGLW